MAIAFGALTEVELILSQKGIEIDEIKILGAMENAVEDAVDGVVTGGLCIFDTLCRYITLYDENLTPEENLQAMEYITRSF